MSDAKSVLKLTGYNVKKIFYEMNNDFDFTKETSVSVTPRFQREINKIDENNVSVDLSLEIKSREGLQLPFHIEITIQGCFSLENWENKDKVIFIENNAVAVLFPYLRTLVTFVTSNANMPPYIIPIMNITELFKHTEPVKV